MYKIIIIISVLLTNSLFAKELEKVSLQLQWLDQFQFAGYYIAKEKGFYKDLGLDVEFKKFKQGINVVDEVESRRVTYGVGRSSLVVDRSNGAKIKAIEAIFQSSPSVLLTIKKSNINTVKDFKNKRVMITTDFSTTVSFKGMINRVGIEESDIEIHKHSLNIDDLINGKTDLMTSYISNEPFLLKQRGYEYKIFDPKNYGFDFYSDILFTSDYEVEYHRERLVNFKNATIKGWKYAFDHIDETVEVILNKYNTQNKSKEALIYEAKELKKLAYFNLEKNQHLGHIDIHKIQRIYTIYKVMGYIQNEMDFDKFIFHNDKYTSINLNKEEKKYLKNKIISQTTQKEKQEIVNNWISTTVERIKDYAMVWQLSAFFLLILSIISFFLIRQNKLKANIELLNHTLEDKVSQQVKEITASQKHFETIFETEMDGIAIINLDSNFLLVNNAYAKMVEMTKEKIYKRSCITMTIPSMIEKSKQVLGTVLREGRYKGYEKQCISGSGKIIDVKMDLTLMPDKKTILMVAKDTTQQNRDKREIKFQEQQLIQQSRLAQMGEMISMIAHQWRQPLAAIGSISASLEIKADLDKLNNKIVIEQASNISKYIQHLSSTIDDFRDFFKPVKSKQEISLNEAVESALNIMGNSIENKNILIIKRLNSKEKFETYSNELKQVILNLLKNAEDILLENEIENAVITLVAESNCLSIKDNGGGVPEDAIDKIYDPYFSTKLAKNGTGLGLYMSKIIIEEHCGGKLSVTNDEDGAMFSILF